MKRNALIDLIRNEGVSFLKARGDMVRRSIHFAGDEVSVIFTEFLEPTHTVHHGIYGTSGMRVSRELVDIWSGGKVFSADWCAHGDTRLISICRGDDWENALVRLLSAKPN